MYIYEPLSVHLNNNMYEKFQGVRKLYNVKQNIFQVMKMTIENIIINCVCV